MLNLKELERKTYTSYYSDGLLEIFLGGTVLFMGIALYFDVAYFFGIIPVLALVFLAYWKQIRRLHLYALLVLAAIFGAPEFGIEPPYYMSGLGVVLLVTGIVMLLRFFAVYPKPERRDIHEGSE